MHVAHTHTHARRACMPAGRHTRGVVVIGLLCVCVCVYRSRKEGSGKADKQKPALRFSPYSRNGTKTIPLAPTPPIPPHPYSISLVAGVNDGFMGKPSPAGQKESLTPQRNLPPSSPRFYTPPVVLGGGLCSGSFTYLSPIQRRSIEFHVVLKGASGAGG